MKLNDNACKNAKPKEKPYKLTDGQGMYLEVRPNGARYWRQKYRFSGKEKLLALGVYPNVSLKEDRMTGHGFRALAMTTIKEKLGYRHEVIDRQLAHAQQNKIIAAYDRAEFLPDRRKMMQEYADYIESITQ
jgi:integrase